MIQTQVTSISLFRFEGLKNKWWAFTQMGRNLFSDLEVEGLQSQKMLGSGNKNGFSIWPNFAVYGLLSIWDNEDSARTFFNSHESVAKFKAHSVENWTVYMQATMAHGAWDGIQPFELKQASSKEALTAVITRATIYPKHLWRFWKFVPSVSRSVENREGLLFAVGIGELPLIQQATFSLWENNDYMTAYAYKSKHHQEVIKKTRALGWYKEELFARFEPFASEGQWTGKDLLKAYL